MSQRFSVSIYHTVAYLVLLRVMFVVPPSPSLGYILLLAPWMDLIRARRTIFGSQWSFELMTRYW